MSEIDDLLAAYGPFLASHHKTKTDKRSPRKEREKRRPSDRFYSAKDQHKYLMLTAGVILMKREPLIKCSTRLTLYAKNFWHKCKQKQVPSNEISVFSMKKLSPPDATVRLWTLFLVLNATMPISIGVCSCI